MEPLFLISIPWESTQVVCVGGLYFILDEILQYVCLIGYVICRRCPTMVHNGCLPPMFLQWEGSVWLPSRKLLFTLNGILNINSIIRWKEEINCVHYRWPVKIIFALLVPQREKDKNYFTSVKKKQRYE